MPEKKLGQNFLINENIVKLITKYVKESPILEIGGGTGFITKELQKKGKVIVIEIDKNLTKLLKKEYNLEVINKDILKINLNKVIQNYNIKTIVSAPPYYLSTELMYKLLPLNVNKIILLMQKDFLEKLNDEYVSTAIGIIANYYKKIEFKEIVDSNSFYPKPKVNSQIVILKNKKRIFNEQQEKFFIKAIKEIFRYNNKKLEKAIKLAIKNNKELDKLKLIIENNSKYLDYRVNEINSKEYVKLFKLIFF